MAEREFPNIGALLASYITQVPEPARPRFLALLERGAAERYRIWAKELPESASGLIECSKREDEIADRVEALFSLDEVGRAKLEALIPGARETYYKLFEGLKPLEQVRIQANAERQGAAAWRGMAASIADPKIREELERCAGLEEASADYLDALASR